MHPLGKVLTSPLRRSLLQDEDPIDDEDEVVSTLFFSNISPLLIRTNGNKCNGNMGSVNTYCQSIEISYCTV